MTTTADLLAAVAGRRLCVVGDLLLDVYLWGQVHRISPEAPVPVVLHERTTSRASGAALAAGIAVDLDAAVDVFGVVGDDEDGRRLIALLEARGACAHVASDPARPTTAKTRVFAQGQQLVRIDREETRDLDPELEATIVARVEAAVRRADAVLVSDYAKGVCTEAVVESVILAADARGIPVVVDPKHPVPGRYAGATAITPNLRELEAFAHELHCQRQPLTVAARQVLDAGRFEWVVVTQAADGMTVVGRDAVVHVPAHATRAVDVSGAGDAAAATLALCLGAGASITDSARMSALVASLTTRGLAEVAVDVRELVSLDGCS